MSKVFCLLLLFLNMSCAYRMGAPERVIPGGYKTVSVPMFTNLTQEPSIEVYFTNSLIQEFERSRVAQVTSSSMSEVQLVGSIESISHLPSGYRTTSELPTLPDGAVLATGYRLLITCQVSVVRQFDKKVLWTGKFFGERTYSAAQVAAAGVNTVNPLYNLSAKRQNIEQMAVDLMAQAHDRITENF